MQRLLGRLAGPPEWAVLAGFILVASAILTFGSSDQFHDGDSLLPAIMSLKKLTWYFWSQDRFANLLPLLASPIRGIRANFYAQLYLRHVCGFGSVLFVLLLAGYRDRSYEMFFAAVVALVLTAGLFMTKFFVQALSQPISCAVFAVGLYLLRYAPGRRGGRLVHWLGITALFWVAFLVNLSLVVLVLPLGVACWLLRIESPLGRGSVCAAMLAAFLLAWWHAQQFPPHTSAGFNPFWQCLNVAAEAIASQINLATLAALLMAAGLVAALRRRVSLASNGTALQAVAVPLQVLALLAALTLTAIVYANTVWAQINQEVPRYFNVIQIFVVVLPSSWAVLLATGSPGPAFRMANSPRWRTLPVAIRRWAWPAWRAGLPLAALLAVAVHAGPPGRLTFVTEAQPNPFAVNEDVQRILAHVPAGRPMLAVGKYWTVVPLVFTRMGRKGGTDSFAAVFHWEPMIPEIAALLQSGKPFTLVCLPPDSPDCLGQALKWSYARPGARTALQYGPASLGDGGSYTVFAVNAPADTPSPHAQ